MGCSSEVCRGSAVLGNILLVISTNMSAMIGARLPSAHLQASETPQGILQTMGRADCEADSQSHRKAGLIIPKVSGQQSCD